MEVSEGEALEETNKPKKRRSYGRIRDANERIRAQTFELGKPCLCKRLKCFEVIPPGEQKRILQNFNETGATSPEPWNAQSAYFMWIDLLGSCLKT